ncbi:antibiotic biosynthesis monooxygenase [Acidipropionibacterium acidipropionici]|uniref:ABM domain-containing protein n=1 Tax=Acidipropionibacterium acidipropionici TaxID=1748 RepID=A0AAC8YET4_9ACTN|nr:antibiotic biosynthesis monooxygenase [Acidipropionibacterium acidipropionici]AMS04742.1 hypothetical protein AXH35_03830 [Acidipropionibacterium acidipropionici]AOZ46232.1 hypothetical protein A8L58_05295 [Acidipropionibacterium acidipropionici]AZP37742.1 antibiotic biosynthesis monooxygenase [Acidipropionibacterium acidipropionici]QCV95212.1 antibiotic biosynthesis monooxygenase [Acidipropionibacterium acidipropionici]
MIVILRFRAPDGQWPALRVALDALIAHLEGCPGLQGLDAGRNVDEEDLAAVVTRWDSPRAWRSAFGGTAGRAAFMAVAPWMVDEPSAYLDLDGDQINLPRRS